MNLARIESPEALRALYDAPSPLAVDKQRPALDEFSTRFLALSPFAILSTCSRDGHLDCSPRGDRPGFIAVLDAQTLAIPDRPGNNRLDSLSNIVANPQAGLLALVPGFGECLRVNGSAIVTADAGLLERFRHNGRLPRSAIVLTVREAYFHCAKSIVRSRLWDATAQADRALLPSLGRILMAQIDPAKSETDIAAIEQRLDARLRDTLY